MAAHPEKKESLWWLAAPPGLWAAHFLLSSATAAVWCGKLAGREGALGGARLAIATYTAVALLAIGGVGWRGLSRYRAGAGTEPLAADTAEDRHRFLGFATFLLAGLGALAILFVGVAAFFFEDCR